MGIVMRVRKASVAKEEDRGMGRLLCFAVVFLAGCQGTATPRDRNAVSRQVDNRCLTIEEQKRLGRDRLSLPETSKLLVPRDYSDVTGPHNP